MRLVLNDEQKMLDEAATGFAARHCSIERVRALRDTQDATGFSRDLWDQCVEMGWVAIPFSEDLGGYGMGHADLAVVLERLGQTLAPEPFLSTVLLAGQALVASGDDIAADWVLRVVGGNGLMALAYQEPASRFRVHHIESRAELSAGQWTLSGTKIEVLDAHVADVLVVAARTSGGATDPAGVSLFLVAPTAAGITVTQQTRIDHRNCATITFENTPVRLLGEVDGGGPALEAAIECATVGLCAEMLGAMQQAFDSTLEYLKTRKQFGVLIGSFQALKHRAARMFSDLQIARACVMTAARTLDQLGPNHLMTQGTVSMAKARCNDAFLNIANEAIQMHGGIGMTDEHDIGFYLKRARVCEMTFGDSAYHRDRWARLHRY